MRPFNGSLKEKRGDGRQPEALAVVSYNKTPTVPKLYFEERFKIITFFPL